LKQHSFLKNKVMSNNLETTTTQVQSVTQSNQIALGHGAAAGIEFLKNIAYGVIGNYAYDGLTKQNEAAGSYANALNRQYQSSHKITNNEGAIMKGTIVGLLLAGQNGVKALDSAIDAAERSNTGNNTNGLKLAKKILTDPKYAAVRAKLSNINNAKGEGLINSETAMKATYEVIASDVVGMQKFAKQPTYNSVLNSLNSNEVSTRNSYRNCERSGQNGSCTEEYNNMNRARSISPR
jgi:hypothetical protein